MKTELACPLKLSLLSSLHYQVVVICVYISGLTEQ